MSVLRDQEYMDWLKHRGCIVCANNDFLRQFVMLRIPGYSVIEPAHTVNNGRGSKGPDSSCIPLCSHHHSEMDGRLSTAITTREAFAAKYGLNLASEAAAHYTLYLIDTGKLDEEVKQ